ncbi:MAG: nitrite reductase small subunit NirD [Hyphomicrobium aestuarii]|nr:nitrite reductase small subunit NirD [Hyphomicrobium aestuarii]
MSDISASDISMSERGWIDIGSIDDIPILGARVVKSPSGCIAVFRTAATEAFAMDDRCPHKGGPLSQGIVHDRKVTCPLHNWVISLETGAAQGADQGQVKTYPLRVENGRMLLDRSAVSVQRAAA